MKRVNTNNVTVETEEEVKGTVSDDELEDENTEDTVNEETTESAPAVNEEEETEEVEVKVEKPETPDIKIQDTEVDTSVIPEKTSKIKMRVNHKCNIGGELYDLKEGQCYNVPNSVKLRLNGAGVLAPL